MHFSYRTIELVPKHVFRTARTICASSTSVVVELSDGEFSGIGEAAPSRFYGEDENTVVSTLERARAMIETSENESELMARILSRWGSGNPAARASVETAAHDMAAKRFGVPLHSHFDLDPSDAPLTSLTVGLAAPEGMLEKALELRGFPILKIKLDKNTDLSIVERIKESTGATIRVDANCAWEPDEAVEKIARLAGMGIEFVEQPVAADDIDGLCHVASQSEVDVFADESVRTSADIPRLAGSVAGIVIKLMKCGGLVEAVTMAGVARENGLSTMLGCMVESSIGITAAGQISPMVDHADLDSAFLLKADPYAGMRIVSGRMILPSEPGLGVRPAGAAPESNAEEA
jgi:L-alanine-DL-glutamate epimerase-like enolase superfamily enzyme